MKSTRVYLNGSFYNVSRKANEKVSIYNLTYNRVKLIATGNTLKEAVINFINYQENNAVDLEMLSQAFKESKYNINEDDYNDMDAFNEDYNNSYNKFINDIDVEKLFSLVRDGAYDNYVLWDNVHERTYTCKICKQKFSFSEDQFDDIEEEVWGHIQLDHEEKFNEVQNLESIDMLNECYNFLE